MSLIPATACMKGDLPLTLRVISHGLMLTPRRTGLRSRCTIEGSIRRIRLWRRAVPGARHGDDFVFAVLTSPSRWPLAAAFSRMGAGGSVERPGRHLWIDVKARLAIHIARGQGFVLPAAQVARSLAAEVPPILGGFLFIASRTGACNFDKSRARHDRHEQYISSPNYARGRPSLPGGDLLRAATSAPRSLSKPSSLAVLRNRRIS